MGCQSFVCFNQVEFVHCFQHQALQQLAPTCLFGCFDSEGVASTISVLATFSNTLISLFLAEQYNIEPPAANNDLDTSDSS